MNYFSFSKYLNETLNFIYDILIGITDFISNNNFVFIVFLIPFFVTCFCIVIDLIFDIRNEFSGFHKFQDYLSYHIQYHYKKNKNKKQFDFNESYQKQKQQKQQKHFTPEQYKKLEKEYLQREYKNRNAHTQKLRKEKYARKNLDVEYDENLAP